MRKKGKILISYTFPSHTNPLCILTHTSPITMLAELHPYFAINPFSPHYSTNRAVLSNQNNNKKKEENPNSVQHPEVHHS